MKSRLLCAVSACVFTFTSITTVQAAPVSGQGTWETTLEGRLETATGSGVFLAYYDTVLDITWATNADINGRDIWDNQVAWAAGLTIGGVSGWRLPTVSPIDGSTFDTTFSNNATTDFGYAPTTTDGTDGGWRDGSNTPVSEIGHMYYVTLGNLGSCTPDDADPSSCVSQPGSGLSNTGPFSNVPTGPSPLYWSGTGFDSTSAWDFNTNDGAQGITLKNFGVFFAWAVHNGDVGAVPVPTAAVLVASVLPTSRSVQIPTPATAFGTIINSGVADATGCGIAPGTPIFAATFSYQTTDPATNALTGTPDTPADIAAGESQSYVFSFTPTADIPPTDVALAFDCTNTDPAAVIPGVNTFLLSASTNPVSDIVALAATQSGDGIVRLPGDTGPNAFAVASVNVGSQGMITASADTGTATLPVALSICESIPATGECLSPPATSVTTAINAGATPTFSIFVTGTGTVPFDPFNNRIFVRFKDAGGVTRGSTSVAVTTGPAITFTPVEWTIDVDRDGAGIHTIFMIAEVSPLIVDDIQDLGGELIWEETQVNLCADPTFPPIELGRFISIRGVGDGLLRIGDGFQTNFQGSGCNINSTMQNAFDNFGLPKTVCLSVRSDDVDYEFCEPLNVIQ